MDCIIGMLIGALGFWLIVQAVKLGGTATPPPPSTEAQIAEQTRRAQQQIEQVAGAARALIQAELTARRPAQTRRAAVQRVDQ